MTHHRQGQDREQMGWAPQGNGYRVQSPEQRPFRGPAEPGEYGGWASGEGQGEFGGQGYSNQGQFPGQSAPQYPHQSYGQDYASQRIGWQQGYAGDERQTAPQGGWQHRQLGGQRFQGESRFGGWQSPGEPSAYAPTSYGSESGRLYADYGGPGGRGGEEHWQQGSGGGYWGQGAGTGQRGWEFHAGEQGSPGQGRLGGERMGGTGVSAAGSWMAGPHSGRGPRGYQRSDARIEEDVCEALTQHGMLDATGVEVRVEGGEVTLSGTVESRQAKRLAEDIIESISGVRDIHNQLRVDRGVEHPIGGSDAMQQQGFAGDTTASAGTRQDRPQSQRSEKQKAGAART